MKISEWRKRQEASRLEEQVWLWLKHVDGQRGHWVREHRFHPTRKWRFDFAREDCKLGIEVEGLLPAGKEGRHQRKAGFEKDCEKYAEALVLGWRVLRVTGKMIRSGDVYPYIEKLTEKGILLGE